MIKVLKCFNIEVQNNGFDSVIMSQCKSHSDFPKGANRQCQCNGTYAPPQENQDNVFH